ncbi:AbgT family transporter [Hoylesella timonensis]|uniref:AbgT family transporter n=1 Tax=Hoylesella timonensis TaxID=386414 RepID=UPI001899AA63|nr:AbgT family transporter [Hoylesella timonensis]
MKHKIFAISIFIFIVLQILVILGSWFVTVVFPTLPVRSMLSSEGIRWFLGQYTSNLASPLLVWLVLAGMTYGALRSSGLSRAIMHFSNISYRQRFALKVVVAELVFFAIVLFLMTFLPQAILLSVTGELFPSSFSRSLIPIVCFLLALFSITYGLINTSFSSLTDIFNSLTSGFTAISAWLVIYVFVIQLYYSILFVVVT